MITLVLVRHAHSDRSDPRRADHDRPLDDRGMRDAPAMAARLAARLREEGLRPDVVLSSTAVRARTTAEAFGAALGVAVSLDPALYGAPASALLAGAAASRAGCVVVVAHDPGMTVLAERLSGGGIGRMPTCAVAVFQWDGLDGADGWDVATGVDPDRWSVDSPR